MGLVPGRPEDNTHDAGGQSGSYCNGAEGTVAGAIFLERSTKLGIAFSKFVNNTAEFGGAIYTTGGESDIYIVGSEFSYNTATEVGGAINVCGGGTNLTINRTDFKFNNATGSVFGPGGSEAGAIFVQNVNSFKLNGCNFINNTADNAGAVEICKYSGPYYPAEIFKAEINNTHFINNTATYANGGAILTYDNPVTVETCEFVNNTAATNGGAIRSRGDAIVKNSVFANNTATTGNAIFARDALTLENNTVRSFRWRSKNH